MSDPEKSSAFSRFSRPAAMVMLMIVMAGLGAFAARYLDSGKAPVHEENHATTEKDTQTAGISAPANHAHEVVSQAHPPADSADLTHSHAAQTQPDTGHEPTHGPDHERDHGPGEARFSASSADPFSEEALGFREPFSSGVVDADAHASRSSATSHDTPKSNTPKDGKKHSDSSVHESSPHATSGDKPSSHAPADSGHQSPLAAVSDEASVIHHVPQSDSHAERSAAVRKQESAGSTGVGKKQNQSREDKVTEQTVNFMAIADEDLASGNYVQAMRSYQSLRQNSQGTPGAPVLFRLALCAEAAGRHSAAIEAYRKISGTQTDPAWAGVSRYGEARCLAAMRRHEGLQTDLLRRAVLDETEFLPTVRNEVLHLIGRDLWREQSTLKMTDLLDDRSLAVPEWSADPVRLLDELPMLIHETPSQSGAVEFQVLTFEDAVPDSIHVRLNCNMMRVDSLLQDLIEGCRLQCEISEEASQLLKGRSQQIRVSKCSLALLLDGLTICSGLVWRQNDSIVRIVHSDELTAEEVRQSRLDAAERILRLAVMDGPGSPQIGHSRLALSTLLFEQKRAADAVQFLQVQIESSPRSVVETEAAFNLGKCLMMLNQRDDAKQAFLRSIDSSGGLIDVKIASYIFHSRLLLEDGQTKFAITSMMRGLSLSEGSELEPFAALQLASVYLMLDNPQGANTVLMARREELMDGPGREGAAFASALARFRAAVLSDRREREGAAVVSALTEFKPADYCGGHWAVLVAGACDELGLAQESTEAFQLALKKLPPSELRNKTVLRLASRYQAENQLEEARLLLATLTSSEADQLVLQARLRSAALALEQNDPEQAILTCRQLIDTTDAAPIERAALRIMGQAFERQQNHQAAIYCFAGVMPEAGLMAPGDSLPAPAETSAPAATTGEHHE